MDRITQITERFTTHFREVGATPVVVSLAEWPSVGDQSNLRVSLGFRRAEAGDKLARFCPELVAAQTAHLDDRDFAAYLDAMQFAVDYETAMVDADLETATAAADVALSDRAPGSLRLMTEVQMAWLDRSTS